MREFLSLYTGDSLVRLLADVIQKPNHQSVHIKKVHGSLDAILVAAMAHLIDRPHLIILQDKEEAAYFRDDLENLLNQDDLFHFPMSYTKAYEYDGIDNANVIERVEMLSEMSRNNRNKVIVTYPEALGEKVVHKKSLVAQTFTVRQGESLTPLFLEEFLLDGGFKKVEFVHESGQFAVRGGIIDVFSFGHELPFRLEFFGNEIDEIRSFNPGSQLSVRSVSEVNLLPNIQNRIEQVNRQSLLEFLPEDVCVWAKDMELLSEVLEKIFQEAQNAHQGLVEQSKSTGLLSSPEEMFVQSESFMSSLAMRTTIEFGSRFVSEPTQTLEFPSTIQPTFKKNFELLSKDLLAYQHKNYQCYIATDQPKQADRLVEIFDEIQPELVLHALPFSFSRGFVDHTLCLTCYTDHQIFERYHRHKRKERYSASKAISLKELQTLQPGDFVTHIDYGIGKFVGLEKREVNGREQESIRLIYRDNDLLYVSIHALHKISRYSGKEGAQPTISKLGSGEWENKKARVKRKVKDIAKELIELYGKRKTAQGFAYQPDDFLQAELESSFLYEDTPDQAQATEDVKKDMMQPHPMDRLVCGDVGFGKTEVAIRAAMKAVTSGKQVAVLVPTTILAFQHYRTFTDRLAAFPININYLSRFKTSKEAKEILHDLKQGNLDIIIGTHRVVNKQVKFQDLGLLIVDEEQKFGVSVKDRLKELKINIDVLTLTATPIPRTLHFSLMGARDLSIIATPPPNRQPVTTELHTFNEELIRDAISAELKRKGQVFFVHNRIKDIEQMADIIYRLVPDSRIGIAHGQMDGNHLEKVMLRFIEGDYDVLVSTNIIESGLDIPNANTIIINHAHLFGMSDLHQMRGRVGRSNVKAYCYLLTPSTMTLTSDARKRLLALEEFSDLGDGFKVAMRDLDIRGAGNLLGAEQSGFINDLGFETYHKILDEAVLELKETEFKNLFQQELTQKAKLIVADCNVETDLEIIIPETYVGNISERLQLYSTLDSIANETELDNFEHSIRDRFGPIPQPIVQLMNVVRLRWVGEALGMERITLKNGRLKAHFIMNKPAFFKSEVFGNILSFVQETKEKCRLKEVKDKLVLHIENIASVEKALGVLEPLSTQSVNQI